MAHDLFRQPQEKSAKNQDTSSIHYTRSTHLENGLKCCGLSAAAPSLARNCDVNRLSLLQNKRMSGIEKSGIARRSRPSPKAQPILPVCVRVVTLQNCYNLDANL